MQIRRPVLVGAIAAGLLFGGLLFGTRTSFGLSIVPADCQAAAGGCDICDLVKIFTNGANLIGGALGGTALLMFIVGGFMLIFSQGQPEKIERGKKVLLGTVTGLAVVFLAWFAVNVIVRVAASSGQNTANGLGTSTKIFSQDWWDQSNCQPKLPTSCQGIYVGSQCGFGECTPTNEACRCYRPTNDAGDDYKCNDDAANIDLASLSGEKCSCSSACSRLRKESKQDYACITAKQSKSGYTVRSDFTCPQTGYVCAIKNK